MVKKMRAWVKAKWLQFKAWTGAKWSKLKMAIYTLLVSLGLVVGVALADDVTLNWANATLWTDGTPMAIDDLAETVLDHQMFPLGEDVSAVPRNYIELVRLPPTVTSFVHANVPNGIHCYVGYHVAKNGLRSDYSNETCKTIDVRLPGTLSGLSAN